MAADGSVDRGGEAGVFFGGPTAIEVFAQRRNHRLDMNEKLAVAHDLTVVGPDVEFTSDNIDMSG